MEVLVYNLNSHPYKEHFKGQDIVIEPEGFIKMEWDDAVLFKGTISPVVRDGDGNPLPQSYKKIKIVKDKAEVEKIAKQMEAKQALRCQSCGFEAVTMKELELHAKEEHGAEMALAKEQKRK